MVSHNRIYTSSEYEAYASAHPEKRFELIHGEIVETMPTQLHGFIVQMLSGFLFVFLRANPIGYALIEARYRLPGDDHNDRIPDLSFITLERGPIVAQGAALYMPDLAVEVQSPDQSDRFIADKAAYYLANGSRMVWLIYPDRKLAEVLTPDDRKLLIAEGTIEGGDVLPGFSVNVGDLFPQDG